MTCIAGIVDNGKVYIGGDSAGVSSNYDIETRLDTKVFVKNNVVFGFTTSFRMGQLLHYNLKIPKFPIKSKITMIQWMVCKFIPAVRKCLKKGGFTEITNNVEEGGTFLIGIQGHLFKIEDDFQVGEMIDGLTAIGCGGKFAKAVLWNLKDENVKPEEKIIKALETAEHFSAGVRRPFKVVCTED